MQIIKLTETQENDWLQYLKNDREEFLLRLLNKLVNKKDIKLSLSSTLMRKLLIEREEISTDNSEYKEYADSFRNINDDNVLRELCKYLDFKNLEYHNLKLNDNNKSLLKKYNVPIDLNQIYNKDLSYYEFDGFIFKGSFDNYKIDNAIFKNNLDINGNKIKINPQTIKDRNLEQCIFKDVIFTDSFDDCNIVGISISNCENVIINPKKLQKNSFISCEFDGVKFTDNFDECNISGINIKNCENVLINPQNVENKDLRCCKLENVEFLGNFDDCDIEDITIKNCKNVSINPQKIKDKKLKGAIIEGATFTDSINDCNITNVSLKNVDNIFVDADHFRITEGYYYDGVINCSSLVIYVKNESGIFHLLSNKHHLNIDNTTTIICNLKYQIKLMQINKFKECRYQTIQTEMDNSLNDVFAPINKEEKKNKEKVKKKTLFDIFKRK